MTFARPLGRRALLAAPLLLAVLPLVVAARTYRAEKRLFYPRRRPVSASLEAAGIGGLHAVAFPSRDGATLRGWYAPSRSRAAVVLAHGAGGDRAQLLPEARALARAGFGVLAFDSPGHGESDGEIHWNAGERAALAGAVDWLAEQPAVDPARIGAFGFSMGGYVVIQVAAEDLRVRAIVAAGAPPDLREQVAHQHARWGPLGRLPALVAVSRGGLALDERRPKDLVASLAPRPLLVVTGTLDHTVPAFLAEELHAAARAPRELLVVRDAGHGGYAQADPAYLPHLVAFFERAL